MGWVVPCFPSLAFTRSGIVNVPVYVVTESPAEGLRESVFPKACPQAVNRDEDVSNPESLSMKISVNHNHKGHLRSIQYSGHVILTCCLKASR